MKRFLFAALLVAGTAVASDDDFLKGDALQAEIVKSCAEGCITFSREEAARFQSHLEALIARKQAEAFAAGVQYQRQACASLI